MGRLLAFMLCLDAKAPAGSLNSESAGANGGPGGSRTLVQTGKPYAFYMLIPDFGFRVMARPGPPTSTLSPQPAPYPLEFHRAVGAIARLFPILPHRLARELRVNSL